MASISTSNMYIYDIDSLYRTADQLHLSPIELALLNWQYDGIFGYNNDNCRFVAPSGEYVLFDLDEVEDEADRLEIDLDGLKLEWQLRMEVQDD